MKKFIYYVSIILASVLGIQNSCAMAIDPKLDLVNSDFSFDNFGTDFDLDSTWEKVLWRVIDKSKFIKAKRILSYFEKPEIVLNKKNGDGETPLIGIFNQSIQSGIHAVKLIEFILDKYKFVLDLNVQDAQGNTFLMNVLHNYNDYRRRFKNDEPVAMIAREIAKVIFGSDILRAQLDLDLKNNQGETTKDIAKRVKLEPEFAKLMGVEIVPSKTSIKNLWHRVTSLS